MVVTCPAILARLNQDFWPCLSQISNHLGQQASRSQKHWLPFEEALHRVIHTTDHDISLQNRIELGTLPLVKSVTPLEPRKGENEESSEYCVLFADKSPEEEESHRTPDVLTKEDRGTCCLFPEVDLGDLSEDQNILVMNMWTEEADSFPKTMIRVCKGYAKGLHLNIYLSDNRPVQKKLHSYSKALVSRS